MNDRAKPTATSNSAHRAAHANTTAQKQTAAANVPAKGPKAAKGEEGQRVETGEPSKTARKRREPGLAPSRSSSRLVAKTKGDNKGTSSHPTSYATPSERHIADPAEASNSESTTEAGNDNGGMIVEDTTETGNVAFGNTTFTSSGYTMARASSLPLVFGNAPPLSLEPLAENETPTRRVSYLGGRRSIPGGFDNLDDNSPPAQQRRCCFSFLDNHTTSGDAFETAFEENAPMLGVPMPIADSPRLRETAEGLRKQHEGFRASMASIAEVQALQKRALEDKDQQLAELRAQLNQASGNQVQETEERRSPRPASPTGTNTTDDLINSLQDDETPPQRNADSTPPSASETNKQISGLEAETTISDHDTTNNNKTTSSTDVPPRRTTGAYALSGTELRDITSASSAVPRPRVDTTQAHTVPPPLHPSFSAANPYDLALTAPDILRPCEVTRFPSGWPWKVEGWSTTEIKENLSTFTSSVWNKKEGPKAVAILMGNNPNVYQPLIRADGTLIEEKQAMDSIRRVFRQETGITVDVFSASTANTPDNYIPMFLVTNLTEDAITFYERLPIGVKTIVSFFIVPWNPPPSPYIFAFDNLHKLERSLANCRLVKEAIIRRWLELPNVRTFLTTKSDTSVPHDTEGLVEFLRQRMEVRAYDLEGEPVFNVYCRPPTVENYSKWMGIVRDNTPYIEYDIDGEVCVTKESRERRNFLGNGKKSGKGKGRFTVGRCSWCTSVDHSTKGCQPVNFDGWLGANANTVTVDTTGMDVGTGKRAPKKKDGREPLNGPRNPARK
ncbi:hypothetical protein PQX77_016025 [Marasmius sp. AFHP31]|nr:hypothetical protein PQX77_016025 [Marasmius sp. AFHP31]